jgi:hypothetical protein
MKLLHIDRALQVLLGSLQRSDGYASGYVRYRTAHTAAGADRLRGGLPIRASL